MPGVFRHGDRASERLAGNISACLLIHAAHIAHAKLKLVNFAAMQHNAFVSSNFCKELDLARFHQRAFFLPRFPASASVSKLSGSAWRHLPTLRRARHCNSPVSAPGLLVRYSS
jgi:hypothetical protein